jgi:hypothetical protein
MKGVINHNKLTIGIIGFSLALYALISVFSKPLTTPEDTLLKKIIVPVQGKDVKKFDMKATARAFNNPSKTLEYSLAFPSSVVRETKNDGRTTNFFFDGTRVASLSFVYNDKKAYTPLSYTENVLGKKLPLAIDKKEVKLGPYSYISAGARDSYFRITDVKGGTWLGSLEILDDNQNLEKMILESLSVK